MKVMELVYGNKLMSFIVLFPFSLSALAEEEWVIWSFMMSWKKTRQLLKLTVWGGSRVRKK